MSRIRKANEVAVNNTLSFLQDLKIKFDEYGFSDVTTSELQSRHNISKSTFSACKKLKFIKNNKWIISNPTRENSLQVLEVLRQTASKRIDVALSDDFNTAIERLTNSMNTLSLQNEKSLKSPLLSRALNQVEQNPGTTLFSETDNKEAKKFDLLKSIAGGCYNDWQDFNDFERINTRIILATEDLFNKFFK